MHDKFGDGQIGSISGMEALDIVAHCQSYSQYATDQITQIYST